MAFVSHCRVEGTIRTSNDQLNHTETLRYFVDGTTVMFSYRCAGAEMLRAQIPVGPELAAALPECQSMAPAQFHSLLAQLLDSNPLEGKECILTLLRAK